MIDTVKLDNARVKMSPAHITTVFFNKLVTARVEQIPKIWTNTGLFFQSASLNTFDAGFAIFPPEYGLKIKITIQWFRECFTFPKRRI
jgi:hypothetical protein